MPYAKAFEQQQAEHARVLEARDTSPIGDAGAPVGTLLLVEHDPPVITVSRRPKAAEHLLADTSRLETMGVQVEPTDRGGDITYHGPGQLVAYPIVDLNRVGLRLHSYIRLLEQAAIDTCTTFGIQTGRDRDATGVWLPPTKRHPGGAKVCAIGVRVRRWVTMHGLALNINTDLSHFDLIVPCGLKGRAVTSIARELGNSNGAAVMPSVEDVKPVLASCLASLLAEAATRRGETPPPGATTRSTAAR